MLSFRVQHTFTHYCPQGFRCEMISTDYQCIVLLKNGLTKPTLFNHFVVSLLGYFGRWCQAQSWKVKLTTSR